MQRFAIGSRTLRPLRAAAVTATTLIVASVALSGSPAYAIDPPGIDPGAVPSDSQPGPAQPMKQNSYCTEVGVLPGSDFRIQPKYMDMLNLSEAWRFGRGAGVRVAVIDTGVTPHPRLPHLIPGGDYVMGGGDGLSDCDAHGTIVTFTVDRLSYSLSPPVVFAIVDFDGGGRLPVELTDVDSDEVAIGGRVEMTFRRLATSDGIHNYFWKARPLRETPREK